MKKEKTILEALVKYGVNLCTYSFYITLEMIKRYSDSDFENDDIIKLFADGYLEYKDANTKFMGLIWIRLKLIKIENDFHIVPSYFLDLYKKVEGSKGLKEHNCKKSILALRKATQEKECHSFYLAQNAEKNYMKRTFTEKCFSKYLKEHDSDFWEQVPIITGNGKRYILDFLIKQQTCIELDGEYHLDNKTYDGIRDIELEKFGIKTFRYTNDEIAKLMNLEMII